MDIIEKLAVFRKSFDNVQLFRDGGLSLFPESEGRPAGEGSSKGSASPSPDALQLAKPQVSRIIQY